MAIVNKETERELKLFSQKKYLVQAKIIDIKAGKDIIVLNEKEALENEIRQGERVGIKFRDRLEVVIVDLSETLIQKGEIGIFKDVAERYDIKDGDIIEVVHVPTPLSIESIIKKIHGYKLTEQEIYSIIEDLIENKLSEAELSAFITSSHIYGLTDEEIVYLIKAMVDTGKKLELDKSPIVDKHSIGGVAGNRVTMVLVPIIAAAGLYIPKTSSRAITSPSGTADTMEVLANVEFTIEELKEIVEKVKGAIVWGGGMNIAPADDYMIRIRRPLHLDPKGLLLASILAKKKAVSSQYVVIDIPVGIGSKMVNLEKAKELAADFKELGKMLGMNISVLITDGSEPIGNGIGPALEARDVLKVLENREDAPKDLMEKSLRLAGKLLEMTKKVAVGDGYDIAKHFLTSGKALKKMKEIIEAQGGNPNVKVEDIPLGEYTYEVKAEKDGKIEHLDNRNISRIARALGAPFDKGAGIYLHVNKGDKVRKGDKLFTLYAESESKITFALRTMEEFYPITMEKLILEEL